MNMSMTMTRSRFWLVFIGIYVVVIAVCLPIALGWRPVRTASPDVPSTDADAEPVIDAVGPDLDEFGYPCPMKGCAFDFYGNPCMYEDCHLMHLEWGTGMRIDR